MSQQITTAMVQQFSDNLIMLSQQKGSKLRDAVMSKIVTGNAAYFERLGPTEVLLRTSRHSQSPLVDTPHSRRMVTINSYEWGDALDKQDEIRILINPESAYAQNAAYAFGRKMDDLIIAAATGNSVSVSSSLPNGDNRTNIALPAAQTITEAGTLDLTLEKLISAKKKLQQANVDVKNEQLYIVCNASAIASLLTTPSGKDVNPVTSADYNTVKALVKGEIDTFMGFTFIQTERILGTADGTNADPKLVLAFAKSGLGLAIGRDVSVRIAERADLSFATYVYGSMDIGAVRVEEEKVVSIQCVQSA